ncbi:MAG: efflux RND transporter periplasmic adaptor subunit [Candidatus Kapabacteria bacterium]|jgi:RND family efflux transporter MFP subunit|nr:efflux RND transporter periplasmic adaptor subunit [Candidatus Kapabacteria bacterium]
MKRYKRNQIVGAVLLLAFTLFFSACSQHKNDATTQKKAEKTTVMVAKPERRTLEGNVELTGSVTPNQEVKLYAMVSGMVTALTVDIGTFVQNGQMIAAIQNPDITQRQQKAEADFLAAKTNYERMATIAKQTPDLVTPRDIERAKADFDGAKAILKGMDETVELMTIRAPFSGVITKRYVNKGAIVQSGTSSGAAPLVDIIDLSVMRIVVDVPETDVPLVREGTPTKITFIEMPDMTVKATVSRISYALKAESKTMRIEIDVRNPNRAIRPGMSASVLMEFEAHPNALVIPNEAITISKGEPCVFRVVNGAVERVAVRLGFRETKFSEVLPGGKLRAEDLVIVRGKELITEGENVSTTQQ